MPRHTNSKEEGPPFKKCWVGMSYDTQTLSRDFFSGIDNWGLSSGLVVGNKKLKIFRDRTHKKYAKEKCRTLIRIDELAKNSSLYCYIQTAKVGWGAMRRKEMAEHE